MFSALLANSPMRVASAEQPAAPEEYRVRFDTSRGPFVVEVHRAWAPLGADRFYQLVRMGFYNGAAIFRMRPGFVAQFGLPVDPRRAEAWHNAKIKDDPVRESNQKGMMSFATDGPDTRTTQVYINLADNRRLDARGFAPFGRVIQGIEVVEQFEARYGEGAPRGFGPDQERIRKEGRVYLEREFPLLDTIRRARVLLQAKGASQQP